MLSNPKRHILILYILLVSTLLIIGYGLLRQPDEPERSTGAQTVSDNRLLFWDVYPELVIPNSGRIIDGKTPVRNQHDDETTIQAVSEGGPLVVFRYSRYDCQLCIDQVLEKLHTVFEGEKSKVCLLIDGMGGREFRMKYKSRDMDFSSYFIMEDNLGLSLENKNMPFLFVLSPDARMDKIFLPFREYPNQTDAYLRNVKALFSD